MTYGGCHAASSRGGWRTAPTAISSQQGYLMAGYIRDATIDGALGATLRLTWLPLCTQPVWVRLPPAPVSIPSLLPSKKFKLAFKLIRSAADKASKSCTWSPNMKKLYREKPAWLAVSLRVTSLGLAALLLLPALTRGQPAWPSGSPPTSLPGESD